MKYLPAFLLAASALMSACGDDDDSTSGGRGGVSNSGGNPSTGGAMATGGRGGALATGGTGGAAATGGSVSEGGAPPSGGSTGEGGGEGESAGAGGEGNAAGAGGGGSPGARHFTLTLENIAATKPFTSAGIFNTPVGDAGPGPATPGKKYEFTITAGRKQKLSFVTMLAATNDLFFGPNGKGIALYDANGDPISGDVTDQIQLWDAGTEVNQEPHVGSNTVTNQAAPNTGPAEGGNVVDIADANNGVSFAYPPVAEIIKVSVTHLTGTQFKVTIQDVSSATALKTSAGDFPAPVSPGVWVVHNGSDPLFTAGSPDRGLGLERIAEDGNPASLGEYVAKNVGLTFPASPGVWVVHEFGTKPLFTTGEPDYGDGLEHIAEDGNPTALASQLDTLVGRLDGAVFNTPVGAGKAGPILPGLQYQVSFDASPGAALSFVSMLAATNDVFFGLQDTGIALFDSSGAPLSGDISSQVYLWDVGSEGNEEPGIGPNTVTNQLAPDSGTPGEGSVQLVSDVHDGYVYPTVRSVLKVTLAAD
jgi:hypothetical protein